MKIVCLSDIHGNKIAFNNFLNSIGNEVDKIFFLGDSIGYYPDGNYILNRLRELNVTSIKGNHEAMLLGDIELDQRKDDMYKLQIQKKTITKSNFQMVEQWGKKTEVIEGGKKILFVHGSPFNNILGYVYPNDSIEQFSKLPYDIIFMGHTHIPMIRMAGHITIVNVGSCGLPRDNGSMGSYVVFDTVEGTIKIVRFKLDIVKIVELYKDYVHSDVIKCLYRSNIIMKD